MFLPIRSKLPALLLSGLMLGIPHAGAQTNPTVSEPSGDESPPPECCDTCMQEGGAAASCAALAECSESSSVFFSVGLGRTRFTRDWSFTSYMRKVPKQDYVSFQPPQTLASIKEFYSRGAETADRPCWAIYYQDKLTADSFLTSALKADTGSDAEIIMQGGAVVQVLTKDNFAEVRQISSGWSGTGVSPDVIAEIPSGAPAFILRVWWAEEAGAISGGLHGLPITSPVGYVVYYQKATTSTSKTLGIIHAVKTGASAYKVKSWTHLNNDDGDWVATHFRGLPSGGEILSKTTRIVTSRTSDNDYTVSCREEHAPLSNTGVLGTTLVEVSRSEEQFADIGGLKRLVRRTMGTDLPSGRQRTTIYGWIDSPSNAELHGTQLWERHPDGSFAYYDKTFSVGASSGSIVTLTPWKDTTWTAGSTPPSPSGCLVTTTTFTDSNSTTEKKVNGTDLISRETETYTIDISQMRIHTKTVQYGVNATDVLTTVTAYHKDDDMEHKAKRIAWREFSDGTAEIYTYGQPNSSGQYGIYVRKGAGDRNGISEGEKIDRIYNRRGHQIAEGRFWLSGSTTILLSSWTSAAVGSFTEFDFAERPLGKIFNNNAADYEAISYGCCGVSYRRDRTGTEIEYFRDELKRVWKTIETTGAVVVTTRTSRAAESGFEGMVTETRRSATGLDHLAGKVWVTTNGETDRVESPDQDGDSDAEATTYTYSYGTGHSVTVTNPDGSTEVSEYYVDGRTKKVSGTAVADTAYDYYAHSSSAAKGVVTKTTRLTSAGGTGEWEESYEDLAGRVISVVYASTLNAPPANDSQTYTYYSHTAAAGSRGKHATSTDPDGVTVSYEYDAEGHLCETTETMPNSAGSRVTEYIHSAVTDGSLGACTSEITKVNGVTVSTVLTKGSGYGKRTSSLGRVTLVERTVASGGDWTETTTRPDGTRTVNVYVEGRLSAVENRDSAGSGGNLVASTSYGYDTLGRLSSWTDSRTGTVTFNSRTESGNLLQGTDAGSRVRFYAYDAMGRRTLVNAKNGTADNVTRTSYHADGSVKAVWGDLTYATFHLYDEQGRMTELRTYRSLAHGTEPLAGTTGADLTTWTYDPGRGWLTAKRDAANKGADYTYTGAGRLETRTWARGARTRYSYDQGMLSDVEYFTSAAETTSDSLTPDLGYTYDAMGRLATVTRGGATHFTYTYSSTDLGLSTEVQNDAFLAPRLLTRKRDSILRPTGYQLGTTADPDLVSEVTRAYDTAGRLSTVSFQRIPGAGSPPPAQTFTYGYNYTSGGGYHVATSPGGSPSFIPFSLTGPAHTAKRTYEATRGSLRELANESLGSDLRSRYTYAVNPLGQREEVEIAGSAYGTGTDFVTWTYDAKGQVTSANSTRGTSSTAHDRYFEYDQIGNRIESRTDTHVASGGSITAYFGNTGATVEGGSALNQYAAIVTPSDSLEPVHDDDGNLTSDGQTWNYAWDGENRMISATPVAPTSGLRRMTYRYDYLGRLASRGYASWNAGTSTWSDFENVRYVYDGWNRIDSINWDTSIRSQYVWGLDLSGTLQGAGGVGGMLLWANSLDYDSTYAVRYPTYDGNGNVTELLDGTGAVAEHWEYDAFGNTVASTNSFAWNDPAQLFEFRFSTKPQDLQTGLYYYGYRFYDPATGRWPSRDPIGDNGGNNLYGFVSNESINFVDYLGLVGTTATNPANAGVIAEMAVFEGLGIVATVAEGGKETSDDRLPYPRPEPRPEPKKDEKKKQTDPPPPPPCKKKTCADKEFSKYKSCPQPCHNDPGYAAKQSSDWGPNYRVSDASRHSPNQPAKDGCKSKDGSPMAGGSICSYNVVFTHVPDPSNGIGDRVMDSRLTMIQCPCCVDTPTGPQIKKCWSVHHPNKGSTDPSGGRFPVPPF